MSVTYRNQTEAPTAEGWFYARSKSSPCHEISPVFVYRLSPTLGPRDDEFSWSNGEWTEPMNEMDWFGPVPKVVEG